jgi:hypothetical protein
MEAHRGMDAFGGEVARRRGAVEYLQYKHRSVGQFYFCELLSRAPVAAGAVEIAVISEVLYLGSLRYPVI